VFCRLTEPVHDAATERGAASHGCRGGYCPDLRRARRIPDRLEGESFYEPGRFGFEKTIAERLEWWAKRRGTAAKPEGGEANEE